MKDHLAANLATMNKDEEKQDFEFMRVLDPAEALNYWLSSKVSSDNLPVQKLSFLCTNFCALEAAENLFNVGSGFAKLDFTGFTLDKILDIVMDIQSKMNVLLKAPLGETVLHFRTTMNLIMADNYKNAYETLKLIKEKATTGIVYADRKDISIKDFEEAVRCYKILILSKILLYSYDEKREFFLPIDVLSEKNRVLIGKEIHGVVDQCIKLQKKVKTKSWMLEKSSKKEKAQNIIDSILQVSYPYMR